MRLLETHCCEGLGTSGYMRAGWTVTAVDIAKRVRKYQPAAQFYVADAAAFIRRYGHEYDAIHTSPACQFYTRGNAGKTTAWPRSIPPIREALESTGRPYVIENVADAAWDMRDPITLCGCMFGLSTIDTDGIEIHMQRPRLFESNVPISAPRACDHSAHEWVAGAYGEARRDKYEAKYVRRGGYVPPNKDVLKALMGVEHDVTWTGLFEGLPPAYTQHLGMQLAAHVMGAAA